MDTSRSLESAAEAKIRAEIEAQVSATERLAEVQHPGILAVLSAYHGYERAIAEVDQYLNALDVQILQTASNSSTQI